MSYDVFPFVVQGQETNVARALFAEGRKDRASSKGESTSFYPSKSP